MIEQQKKIFLTIDGKSSFSLFCFCKRRNDLVITWSILTKFLDTFLPFLKN